MKDATTSTAEDPEPPSIAAEDPGVIGGIHFLQRVQPFPGSGGQWEVIWALFRTQNVKCNFSLNHLYGVLNVVEK